MIYISIFAKTLIQIDMDETNLLSDEELRKFCIEKAVAVFPDVISMFGMHNIQHPIDLAEQFYNYIKSGNTDV